MSRKNIPAKVKNELGIITAGRCSRCNIYLKEDFLTKAKADFAENAHIIASSPDGPRGSVDTKNTESIENIILLCSSCHTIVDKDTKKYTEEVLFDMKKKHCKCQFKKERKCACKIPYLVLLDVGFSLSLIL